MTSIIGAGGCIPTAVTFVVLNWKAEAMTALCIQSIRLLGSSDECPVVIVDNESTDRSYSALLDLSPAAIIRHRANVGFAAGCNSALPAVHTDYVAFVNNDCLLPEDWLVTTIRHFEDPAVGLVGGGEHLWRTEQDLARQSEPVESPFLSVLELNFGNGSCHALRSQLPAGPVGSLMGSNLLARTSLIRELGGFDKDFFAYWEDTDLCARVMARGFSLVYEPRASIQHRRHYSSDRMPTRKEYLLRRNQMIFIAKHFPDRNWLFLVVRLSFEDMWFGLLGRKRGLRRPTQSASEMSAHERVAHVQVALWGFTHLPFLVRKRRSNKRRGEYSSDFPERVRNLQLQYSVVGE